MHVRDASAATGVVHPGVTHKLSLLREHVLYRPLRFSHRSPAGLANALAQARSKDSRWLPDLTDSLRRKRYNTASGQPDGSSRSRGGSTRSSATRLTRRCLLPQLQLAPRLHRG